MDEKMTKRDELKSEYTERREHIDRRLLLRLRAYFILMLIEFAIIVYEVLLGSVALTSALFFGAVGLIIGIIMTRRFHLSWDEKTNTVAGSTDAIGVIILVCYLIFVFSKPDILGLYEQGHQLLVALLALSAGTQLGRIIGTRRGVIKLQRAVGA
jgi:heme/copper-type cytochrome/quinol oxidase subunit 4